jgi:hypothetical protein
MIISIISNDVASVVVVRWQGTFRNRQGYFNETWCENTFGQFDLFCGLQAAILKITLLPFKS